MTMLDAMGRGEIVTMVDVIGRHDGNNAGGGRGETMTTLAAPGETGPEQRCGSGRGATVTLLDAMGARSEMMM